MPEGTRVGERVELLPFQEEIILGIYDSDPPARRIIVSMGRKNAKSCLTAMLLLAAVAGPAFRPNAQVYSSAQSREPGGSNRSLIGEIEYREPERTETVCTPALSVGRSIAADAAADAVLASAGVRQRHLPTAPDRMTGAEPTNDDRGG